MPITNGPKRQWTTIRFPKDLLEEIQTFIRLTNLGFGSVSAFVAESARRNLESYRSHSLDVEETITRMESEIREIMDELKLRKTVDEQAEPIS